jgi:hypothetical protein
MEGAGNATGRPGEVAGLARNGLPPPLPKDAATSFPHHRVPPGSEPP